MKKITVIFLTLLSMFTIFGLLGVQTVKAAEPKKYIFSTERTTILVNTGEAISRNNIELHFGGQVVTANDFNIAAPTAGLEVAATHIKATSDGVHRFLLQHQSLNVYAYVISKSAAANEYLLYEENYDGIANGQLPDGYQLVSGKAHVLNGKLIVDAMTASPAMVLLPEHLKGLTNYIIETDFTIKEAKEGTRWASVMFRYSPKNYFQMAIRQGATANNGIEFAKSINNAWNVPITAAYKENIDANKSYRLKIEVFQNKVKEYINDELIIEYNQAIDYERGFIGMQANGSTAVYDNVKVRMPMEYDVEPKVKLPNVADVYEPVTGIINPPTTLTRFKDIATLNTYVAGKRPATLILNVNNDLQVLDSSGNVAGSLEEILVLMNGKMIPAIETEDAALAKLFSTTLLEYQIMDFFVISKTPEVILAAREDNEMARGILKINEIPENLHDIRGATNSAQAIATLLPAGLIDKKMVNYLQHRLVTVFAEATSNLELDLALFSGVNGILTDKPIDLINKYEAVTEKTHIREVFFIAHRGLHNGYNNSLGPENSLEVSLAAYERGAKIIEIDIHLTKDKQLVVMHDNTTNRTAEFDFTVASTDLEWLVATKLKDVSNTGREFKIPSFADFLDAFKDKDVVLFVEVKPTNAELMQKLHELLIEKDMYEKVVVIMFGAQNAITQKTVSPEMSNGHLVSGLITDNKERTLLNVLSDVVPIKTTFNTQYGGLTSEIVRALTHRGVTIWPWTVDALQDMKHLYEAGVGGITTNNFDLIKDSWLLVEFERTSYEYNLKTPQTFRIAGKLKTHDQEEYPLVGNLILIDDGGTGIEINNQGEVVKATNPGVAYFYTKTIGEFPDGTTYQITSDVIKITVVSGEAPDIETPGDDTPTPGKNKVGLIIGLTLGGLAVVGGGAALTFFLIRKKNKGGEK